MPIIKESELLYLRRKGGLSPCCVSDSNHAGFAIFAALLISARTDLSRMQEESNRKDTDAYHDQKTPYLLDNMQSMRKKSEGDMNRLEMIEKWRMWHCGSLVFDCVDKN